MARNCLVLVLAGLLAGIAVAVSPENGCQRSQACWPTDAEVNALSQALDPSLTRLLVWKGYGYARVCGVGVDTPGQQPLYGLGTSPMAPVYVDTDANKSAQCFVGGYRSDLCDAATRGTPYHGWQPAFVVWPLTVAHVQTAVRFAVAHNLPLCVAGTGHDYLNRHSCGNNGLMLRTSLFASMEYVAPNALRVGSGVTFAQLQQKASSHSQFVASGWAPTVGVAGWSLGGGHGPFDNFAGLGVDNVLEVELVAANASLVTTNASGTLIVDPNGTSSWSTNTDLFWALRGGGGSTWGVLTSLTIRTHDRQPGGYMNCGVTWQGLVGKHHKQMHELIESYLQFVMGLGPKWSGLVWFTPAFNATLDAGTWQMAVTYVFLGGPDDPDYQVWSTFTAQYPELRTVLNNTNYDQWWDCIDYMFLEPLVPVTLYPPSTQRTGGLPSVLIARDKVNTSFKSVLAAQLDECVAPTSRCTQVQVYQDLTGNIGATQAPGTAVNPGMRSALLHAIFMYAPPSLTETVYQLGNYSYFAESAYTMPGWQARYWGDNYARLAAVKAAWDPHRVFGCFHCVGDSS